MTIINMKHLNGNNQRAFSLPPENNNNNNNNNNKMTYENVNGKIPMKNIYSHNYSFDFNDHKQEPIDSELMLQETFNNFDMITRQFMGLSPSSTSLNTDEDSGYVRTSLFGHGGKLTDSICSIFNSGHTVSEDDSNGINCTSHKDELLFVMIEDLVDWFKKMYPNLVEIDLNSENFFDRLSDGILLCYHATELHNRLAIQSGNPVKNNKPIKLNDGLRISGVQVLLPTTSPSYQTRGLNYSSNATVSFISRDNVANFIQWCRQLGMPNSTLFESEDLVCRKNPRNVIVCLLELARLGGHIGMCIPEIVQLEVEIDEQLARENLFSSEWNKLEKKPTDSYTIQSNEDVSMGEKPEQNLQNHELSITNGNNSYNNSNNNNQSSNYRSNRSIEFHRQQQQRQQEQQQNRKLSNYKTKPNSFDCHEKFLKDAQIDKKLKQPQQQQSVEEIQRPKVDFQSLDELVRELLSQCTCKQTFPMVRIGEGRYLFGDKSTQIFVRILRNHVMVRVGGGWDTLSHFLSKYDECRKTNPVKSCQLNSTNQQETANPIDHLNKNHCIQTNTPAQIVHHEQTHENILQCKLNFINNNNKERTLSNEKLTQNHHHCGAENSRVKQMNNNGLTQQFNNQFSQDGINKNYTQCEKHCTLNKDSKNFNEPKCPTKSQFRSELNLSTINDEDFNYSTQFPRYKLTDQSVEDVSTTTSITDKQHWSNESFNDTTINSSSSNMHSHSSIDSNLIKKPLTTTTTTTDIPLKQKSTTITIVRPNMEKSKVTTPSYVVVNNRPYILDTKMYSNQNTPIRNHHSIQQKSNLSKSLNSLNINSKKPIMNGQLKNSKPVELITVLPNKFTKNNYTTYYNNQQHHEIHIKNPTKNSTPIKNSFMKTDYQYRNDEKYTVQQQQQPQQSRTSQQNQKRSRSANIFTSKKISTSSSSSTPTTSIHNHQSRNKPVQIVYTIDENKTPSQKQTEHFITVHNNNSNLKSKPQHRSLIPIPTRSYSSSRIPVKQY